MIVYIVFSTKFVFNEQYYNYLSVDFTMDVRFLIKNDFMAESSIVKKFNGFMITEFLISRLLTL